MDFYGNFVILLIVDWNGEQSFYFLQIFVYICSYLFFYLDYSLVVYCCGLEYWVYFLVYFFCRFKLSGCSFFKVVCFFQYEIMYQYYYFQGFSYLEQEGQFLFSFMFRGLVCVFIFSVFFFSGSGSLFFFIVVYVVLFFYFYLESGSMFSFSCYYGYCLVCSGYLVDCLGSDSSSSSSFGQCYCFFSDFVVDCIEVSNQGVYGSCFIFCSFFSSDYDFFIYCSWSFCCVSEVGGLGSLGWGFVLCFEGFLFFEEFLVVYSYGVGWGEFWLGFVFFLGDQVFICSLEMNYSSNFFLEYRGFNSFILEVGFEVFFGVVLDFRRIWKGGYEGLLCVCCCEF